MKTLTRKQVEGRKSQAVRFLRDVLDDSDRAGEIENESVEDYAERRRIQLINPHNGGIVMARSREQFQDRVAELEAENGELLDQVEELEGRLDEISDIVAPEEEYSGEEESAGEE